jgi:hypothetical protein
MQGYSEGSMPAIEAYIHKEMVVGREYDFSIGNENDKMSPETLLEQAEEIVLRGLLEKHGQLYELNASCDKTTEGNSGVEKIK